MREIEAGTPATEVARRLGVHLNTLLRWKKHYGGLGVPRYASCVCCAKKTVSSSNWSRI
ncbi:MAG: transposase [Candidatus Eremiobacteraeota bacterium]|nr:transposase [Candidatus Eremiobacteraeota bacterium]